MVLVGQDAIQKLLPFLRDHFDARIEHVASESAVCIAGKAEGNVVRMAAECLDHALHVCRDEEMEVRPMVCARSIAGAVLTPKCA